MATSILEPLFSGDDIMTVTRSNRGERKIKERERERSYFWSWSWEWRVMRKQSRQSVESGVVVGLF